MMAAQSLSSDFCRFLQNEILEVNWVSAKAGSRAFRSAVTKFVGTKLGATHAAVPEDLISDFKDNLKAKIQEQLEGAPWRLTEEQLAMWTGEIEWIDSEEFQQLFAPTVAVWLA